MLSTARFGRNRRTSGSSAASAASHENTAASITGGASGVAPGVVSCTLCGAPPGADTLIDCRPISTRRGGSGSKRDTIDLA